MSSHLEELVESLLYEGYALYPYTPGAVKNATPTPFGIVYPPAYAERMPAAYDHVRMDCELVASEGAPVSATVRFLQAGGEERRAIERRLEIAAPDQTVHFDHDGLQGRARLRVDPLGEGLWRVRVCVHNTTPLDDPDATRGNALRSSLMSTHVVATAPGSRFVSATESELESVNIFPVLATPADDTMLGATIMLPDHPRVAPQSRGNLYDGTEIEEALLLHVHALSDGEREEIAASDPAVRAMVERAAASTPEDLFDVHGVMAPSRPEDSIRGPETTSPPEPPEHLPDLSGDPAVTVGGVTFRRGERVKVRTAQSGDPYDRMVDGRTATIEKILHDVDDKLYFAVTIDGPGQELLRETGRHQFFFAGEVEPL